MGNSQELVVWKCIICDEYHVIGQRVEATHCRNCEHQWQWGKLLQMVVSSFTEYEDTDYFEPEGIDES